MTVHYFPSIFSATTRDAEFVSPVTGDDLLAFFHLERDKAVIKTEQGIIEDYTKPLEGPCVWLMGVPASSVAAAVSSIVISLVIGAASYVVVQSQMAKLTNAPKLSSAASLRGSMNVARKGERLPIVLGRYKVVPDLAAQVYTTYEGNDQYLHQLFCFGYSEVVIDTDSLKIGTTPVSKYNEITWATGDNIASIYPRRTIETTISLELEENAGITRSTATGTVEARIGIAAPSGYYAYNEEGDKYNISISLKIDYRATDTDNWVTAYEGTITPDCNASAWRWSYTISLPYSSSSYDIRVTRTSAKSSDSRHVDYAYWDVLTCMTQDSSGNTYAVRQPSDYSLLAVRAKATNQLNSYIDELSAYATLSTRYYNGSAWVTGPTRNPASAVLYLLTDPLINPRSVDDSVIDWDSFVDFYTFCADEGFTCDGHFIADATIEELASSICLSNLAELVIRPSVISVRIDKAQSAPVQLFNPRNVSGLSMSRSFEKADTILKCTFNCEDVEYAEVERTIRINGDGSISYDTEISQDENATEVSLSGVTKADHAARVLAVKLKQMAVQKRTYSWNTDIEGLLCIPGDIVLLSTDSFLYGLGEARVVSKTLSGIEVDSEFTFVEGRSYGIRHRKTDGSTESIPIVSFTPGSTYTLDLSSNDGIEPGDLISFGYRNEETHTVQITSISVGENKVCTITAVDYDSSVYDDTDEIPPYDPGISLYPEGTQIGIGKGEIPDRPSIPGTPAPVYKAITQYAWGVSDKLPPSPKMWVWRGKFYIWKKRFIGDVSGLWSEARTNKPSTGTWYLWIRWSFDGGATWTEPVPISGNDGKDARDFRINGPDQFFTSSRGTVNEAIELSYTIDRTNLEGDITWTANTAALNAGLDILPGADDSCTVTIPVGFPLQSFQLTATIDDISRRVQIYAKKASEASRMYLGIWPRVMDDGTVQMYPTKTPDGDALISGDSIVYNKTDGDGGAVSTILVYYKPSDTEGSWIDTAEDDTLIAAAFGDTFHQIVLEAAFDVAKMAKDGVQPVIDSGGWSFFNNVAFIKAFADFLSARAIRVMEAIYGGAYLEDGTLSEEGGAGFWLGANGILRAVQAYLNDVFVSSYDGATSLLVTQKSVPGATVTLDVAASWWSLAEMYNSLASTGTCTLGGVTYSYTKTYCPEKNISASSYPPVSYSMANTGTFTVLTEGTVTIAYARTRDQNSSGGSSGSSLSVWFNGQLISLPNYSGTIAVSVKKGDQFTAFASAQSHGGYYDSDRHEWVYPPSASAGVTFTFAPTHQEYLHLVETDPISGAARKTLTLECWEQKARRDVFTSSQWNSASHLIYSDYNSLASAFDNFPMNTPITVQPGATLKVYTGGAWVLYSITSFSYNAKAVIFTLSNGTTWTLSFTSYAGQTDCYITQLGSPVQITLQTIETKGALRFGPMLPDSSASAIGTSTNPVPLIHADNAVIQTVNADTVYGAVFN